MKQLSKLIQVVSKSSISRVIFILFLTVTSVYSQDIITFRNGDEIMARVMEISSSEIRYKRFENIDGPTIVIPRTNVFFINFENGTREVFTLQTDQPVRETPTAIATAAYARNPVSNIRVQQHGSMLHVMYDLDEKANIEVRISFNNGATYRKHPLQHVSGVVGRNIYPGKNRLLIWDIVREIGYIDYSDIVIRIVPNGIVLAENIAETDISSVLLMSTSVRAIGKNNIFNIRVENPWRRKDAFHLRYDLGGRTAKHIRVFVSFDDGVTYIPLQRVAGFTRNISPGKNKLLEWDARHEFGRKQAAELDFSNVIFKVVAETR